MKSLKRDIFYSFMLLVMIAAGAGFAFVQKNVQDADQIKKIIESKRYIFKAESVIPARGSFQQLTGVYDLTINGDTLVSYLPFFGRAYTATLNPDDAAIKFTSINFSYDVKKTRKNGWQIDLFPKDTRKVREMLLSISEDGRGSLLVLSNDRERISFDGYITELKPPRDKSNR